MANIQWIKSSFKGIRFHKHKKRRHGVKYDRYFRGSYQVGGTRKAINFGWASEGWSESIAWEKINFYRMNAKTGSGPTSLKIEREIKEGEKAKEKNIKVKRNKTNLTLNDFFNSIYYPQIQKEKKLKTHLREESLFRLWIDTNIGHLPFKEITKSNIENIFYGIVDSGKSIRSAEYALTTLKQIWREAKEAGYAPDMPALSKTLKKKISQNNNARIRFLSHDEANTLLEELRERSQDLYEKTLISLHCGLRAKEIFTLTWSQIDLAHGIFNIIDSKGKDRSVHMSEQVKEIMLLKTKRNPDELIYPGRQGRVSTQISQVFREVAKSRPTMRLMICSKVISDIGVTSPIVLPSRKTIMRSAICCNSSILCEMYDIHTPCFFNPRMISKSASTSLSVRADVGSSKTRISAFLESALAISTICCLPTVNSLTLSVGIKSVIFSSSSSF